MEPQLHLPENVYQDFAAAFVRGRFALGDKIQMEELLVQRNLEDLSNADKSRIYSAGRDAGLRLSKFKRTMGLARVQRVLGTLRSIMPSELLDVGSGRGAFLWPLLDAFPDLPVTAIDMHPQRATDLRAVAQGGITRLESYQMDVTELEFEEDRFDVVTALEVLEHIPDVRSAIRGVVRVARRFVIASVPSKPDDNPEHIHLLTRDRLDEAFRQAGCHQVTFNSVLNHLLVVATVTGRS